MSPETKIEATRSRGIAWVVGVGASRGLGAAAARRFARGGFTVAVTGRSPEALEAIVTEIKAAGGQAIAATGDAQDEASMIALLHKLEEMGPVEVGIYNAGNAAWGPPLQMRTADFEAVWRVGCLGGFIFGRELGGLMQQRGRGTIIYSGASASLRGKAAFAGFAAAKAGLRMVSQAFARELGPSGVHVVHAIIDGSIEGDKIFRVRRDIGNLKGPNGLLDPDAIAESYWYLHSQHRSAWTQEIDLRPFSESF